MTRNRFDRGEIEFVAENMEVHTREYVIATRQAALRRARDRRWSGEPAEAMRKAADTMGDAIKTWPRGRFDSRIT